MFALTKFIHRCLVRFDKKPSEADWSHEAKLDETTAAAAITLAQWA